MHQVTRLFCGMLLILLTRLTAAGQAPDNRRDSLLMELEKHRSPDIERVALLVYLSETYYLSDPAKGIQYADEALHITKAIGDNKFEGNANRLKGLCFYMQSDYAGAQRYFRTAFRADSLRRDELGMAASLTNLALVDMTQSRFPPALANYLRALTTFEKTGNIRFASTVNMNIGIIYSEQEHYEKALAYQAKALSYFEQLGHGPSIAMCLGNMGVIASKQNQTEKALTYFKKALDINTQNGVTSGIARENGNVGSTLARLGEYRDARLYLEKALEIYRTIDNKKGIATNTHSLGHVFMKLGSEEEALRTLKQGLRMAKEIGLLDVQQEATKDLSDFFDRRRLPDSALAYYKQFIVLRDSVNNEQRRKQITRMEMQYEFDKKENAYRQQQLLSEARVREQDLMLAVNREQLAGVRREQKIQQLAHQNTRSLLRVAELDRREQARKRTIAEQERNEQISRLKVLSQETELIRLRNRQQILYASLGGTLLVLAFGLVVSRARARQIRLKNELDRQQADQLARDLAHERQLLESELKSIRSQMNPHFIFNVLNSIESYILEKEPAIASRLVQKFAALSRLILENSTRSLVTADREWKVLQLYAELEAVRFGHQFAYRFDADTELPLHQLLIPPMLVQPLIENAILHGLRPYTGHDGLLEVRFTQAAGQAVFSVTDNGVGLDYRNRETHPSPVKQQSLALKAIRDRVSLLNRSAQAPVASFTLSDRGPENERGTVATLRLPVRVRGEET